MRNIKAICDEYLRSSCDLEAIDLTAHPELAKADNIVALPTLVKLAPEPKRRMVGDLSDRRRTLAWLGLAHPVPTKGKTGERPKEGI